MRTILNKTTRDEVIRRINALNENNTALWGKMNVRQMVKHGAIWDKMALGKTQHKREFLGYLIGGMVKKFFFKSDKPMDKNVPAGDLAVKGPVSSNFEEDKKHWISLIEEYGQLSGHEMIHPFFGKLTQEQVGLFAFKHADHHLRQFNV